MILRLVSYPLVCLLSICATTNSLLADPPQFFPASDAKNDGDWQLVGELSDEFNGQQLDMDKWFVQGTGGKFYRWKGRAPSQYAPSNVDVGDGLLQIFTRWQPEHNFADEEFDGRAYRDITTAGIVSQNRFLHGYMETRSRAANAAIASAFWALGHQSELDVFEQMGRINPPANSALDREFMFSIHDWRTGVTAGKNRIFTKSRKLPFRVAEEFHVYGCQWEIDSLKFFLDGRLIHTATRKELDDAWLLTNPLEVWFDSETFPWFGLPTNDELPVSFDVDYVRVWQKPPVNLLDPSFHGFEGPLTGKVRIPNPKRNTGKQWFMPDTSKRYLSIDEDKYFNGRYSLKFTHDGPVAVTAKEVSAMAPNGSCQIEAGTHVLRFRVWKEKGSTISKLHPILDEPWLQIHPIDLSKIPPRQWIEIVQPFSRPAASGPKDRLRITFRANDITGGKSTVHIDDLSIEKSK